jgi:hypothetical protein
MLYELILVGLIAVPRVATNCLEYRNGDRTDGRFTIGQRKRTVHISYVCAGQRESVFSDESAEGMWLTLRNDSGRSIFLRTYRRPRPRHPCAAGVKREVGIYYEVVEKESYTSEEKQLPDLPVGYPRPEIYMIIELKPHSSVVFSVAREHLTPKRAIYVNFWYSQKRRTGVSNEKDETLRRAYFYSSELPEQVKGIK